MLDKLLLEILIQHATGSQLTKMLSMSSVKKKELFQEDPSGPLIDKHTAQPEDLIKVNLLMLLVHMEINQEIFCQLEPVVNSTKRMN